MSDTALDLCQQAIEYRFKDQSLLSAALTHASVAANRLASNERMEFFGDSVLGMVVCRYLYEQYPDLLEGELTKIKSAVVSRKTCAEVSEKLGLPQWLYLGSGISSRSKLPLSVAAAVFESLIAAMTLDAGVERTSEFILKHMLPSIEEAAGSQHQNNYKSQLQQYAQREKGATPVYEMLDEKGPDHSKCFEIAVCIAGRRYGSAWGPSKKEAEQKAAWNALVELNLVKDETAVAP
jgi:ribonuclease-3